ncbi:MAG: endonuclease/exonuclease/phosphatase family protein [Owenweeksia sp.]
MAGGKHSFLDSVLYFINVLAALGLLASYLAYYFNPNWFTFFSFAGLAYPVLLFINLIFIIYWMLRFKVKLVLPVICIAMGYLHLSRLYQWGAPNKVVNPGESFKVMTYNVRMFNAYKWIPEDDIPQRIKQLILTEAPDILMLQEFYQSDKTPELDYPYDFTKLTNDGRNYGLTILSKFPITGTGTLRYSEPKEGEPTVNNEFIYADVKWKNETIRFINIHLASVGLGVNDYKRLENPNEGSQEDITNGFLKIIKRLHWAFQRRGEQIGALEKAIADSPHPVVLCGDFNDTPQSYIYHRVDLALNDSFMEAGNGFSKTYARGPVPFRIDYVFHSDELRVNSYKVISQKLSDHYPVITELEF